MSEFIDLRGRIADVLFDSNVRGRNVSADDWDDPEMRESFRSDAQAIIDGLGLTVEERCAQEPTPVRRSGRTEWDNREVTLHRIVGRWEVDR